MKHFSVNEFIWGRRYATLRRESFDSSIRKDFWIWSANHESLAALFLTYCFLSATQAPAYYDAIVYSNCLFILPAIGLVTVFFSMWMSFFYQCFGNYLPSQRYHMFWMKKVPFMRTYTAVGSIICFIFRLLTRSIIKECHEELFGKYKWNCLPSGPNLGTTDEIGVCLMALPLIFSAIYRELDMKLYLSIWGLTIGALFCAAHLGDNELFYTIAGIFTIPSFILIFEKYRYNNYMAFIMMDLQKTMKEKDEMADEVHATEMRHMIANVAHDLKTPLMSFLSGIELISDIALECQQNLRDNREVNAVQDNILSILNCVQNIRNTNSFMLMTINRCIDYTKASKGLKLVPKYETIDLVLEEEKAKIGGERENDDSMYVLSPRESPRSESSQMIASSTQIYPMMMSEDLGDGVVRGEMGDNDDHNGHVDKTPNQYESFLRIEIEDHGIGLSEEAMANLFNPFKQAQRLAGGTGLGLYSLARRMEALNGFYGVSHRRDGKQGSVFWFSIPYRADVVTADDMVRKSLSPRRSFMRYQLPTISEDCGKDRSLEVMDRHSEECDVVSRWVIQGSEGARLESPASNSTLHLYDMDSAKMNGGNEKEDDLSILVVDDSPTI
eukprot:scaffold1662_cov232-Ochromonas_danica.AAC.1